MQRQIAFCLCPGLPLFCIASALEVLRHANRYHGSAYYRWSFVCEDDRPVRDSNGLRWQPNLKINSGKAPDLAFIVAGFGAGRMLQPRLCAWLDNLAEKGASIGGISNGAFVLAANGLLDDYQATTHWDDFESFCVLFPRVRARYQRYVIDRRRMTCSGGSATLDLFIELARQDLGNEIALKISRQILLQEQSVVLPGSPSSRLTGRHYSPQLQRALRLIEAGVGQAISVAEVADRTGISRRELLRRFRKELNSTPSGFLAQRRLDRARSLILNTRLPIAQVADSVGFSSQSHLTSSYRARFGITPAQQRREYDTARQRLPLTQREIRDW